jgi:hypothetical protein
VQQFDELAAHLRVIRNNCAEHDDIAAAAMMGT